MLLVIVREVKGALCSTSVCVCVCSEEVLSFMRARHEGSDSDSLVRYRTAVSRVVWATTRLSWVLFGAFWVLLGAFWVLFCAFWVLLGAFWVPLSAF